MEQPYSDYSTIVVPLTVLKETPSTNSEASDLRSYARGPETV